MRRRGSNAPRQASTGRSTARKPSPNSGVALASTSTPAAATPAPTMVRRAL